MKRQPVIDILHTPEAMASHVDLIGFTAQPILVGLLGPWMC